MGKLFYLGTNTNEGLKLFSLPHFLILTSLLFAVALIVFFRKALSTRRSTFRHAIAYLLIFFEVINQIWYLVSGQWNIKSSLPLHLCGITSILCIFMLLGNSYFLFEILYFWGLVGSPVALILPDLKVSYNNISFWVFIMSHSLNVISVVYMMAVEKFRPMAASITKCFITTNIYMFFIGAFNYIVGSNYYYFYLRRKPAPNIPNPLMQLKSWPLIIISLEIITIIAILVFYLPYHLSDIRKGRAALIKNK